MTLLFIARNDIGPEGVGCLADMLRVNHVLGALDVGNNAIPSDGLILFADALTHNTRLSDFDLRGDLAILTEDVERLEATRTPPASPLCVHVYESQLVRT